MSVAIDILLCGAAFLLPGVAVALLLRGRCSDDPIVFAYTSLIASAAAAYIVFWPFLFNVRLAQAIVGLVAIVSLSYVITTLGSRKVPARLLAELGVCFLLMILVGTAYSGIGYLYEVAKSPEAQADHRFRDMPADNIVPLVFATTLYDGKRVRPFLFGDWKSSDRPPLQAGATLFQLAAWNPDDREWHYQNLGVFLQTMWVAAVWIILRGANVSRRAIVIVGAFCICSALFLIHSFFVWPKMLSAGLFLLALCALRFFEGRSQTSAGFNTAVAGAGVGTALLSHPGVAFSFVALILILIATRGAPGARRTILGLFVLGCFLTPWILYQRLYDPPGDRLLKWHFAGAMRPDSKSFLRTLKDAYTKPPLRNIASAKLQNFETVTGIHAIPALISTLESKSADNLAKWFVETTFFNLLPSIGVLNLGFLVLGTLVLRSEKQTKPGAVLGAQRLLCLACLSVVIWCLLKYLPGSTVIHEGSLADPLLLCIGLALILVLLTPRLCTGLLIIQVLLFLWACVIATPVNKPWSGASWTAMSTPMALLAVAGLAALVVLGAAWAVGQSRPEQRRIANPF